MIAKYKKLHNLAIKTESLKQKEDLISKIFDILKEAEQQDYFVNWFGARDKQKFIQLFLGQASSICVMPSIEENHATVYHQKERMIGNRRLVSYDYAISILQSFDLHTLYKEF